MKSLVNPECNTPLYLTKVTKLQQGEKYPEEVTILNPQFLFPQVHKLGALKANQKLKRTLSNCKFNHFLMSVQSIQCPQAVITTMPTGSC